MAGIITWPIEAASETDEPEIPPKIMLAMTLTMPRPPRNRPTNIMQKSISRCVSPPWFIRWPMMMKSGREIITDESMPEKTRAGSTVIRSGW